MFQAADAEYELRKGEFDKFSSHIPFRRCSHRTLLEDRSRDRDRTTAASVTAAFYRAMHFSAKRSLAIACRLSVCPSICDVGGSGPHMLEILETNCRDN